MKFRRLVIPCVLATFVALAPQTGRAVAGWTNGGVITELNQQAGGGYNGYVFVTASVTGNPSVCTSPTLFYFTISDERHKRMFSMLLAAQATGRQIKFWATDTCHPWGASLLDGVIIVS
jgi:hypothetical protein